MHHPFKRTEYTDVQVKLQDTVLHLSSDLLKDLTDVNQPTCLNIGVHNNDLTTKNDGPCSSGSSGDTGSECIDLSEYNSYDVIEFFKHLYPEQTAKLTGRNNFKTMLELCERFKVEWLKTKVENYMRKLVYKDDNFFTETHLSLFLSLTKEFKLEKLKAEIEEELVYRFRTKQYQAYNDSIFHVVSHYGLKSVHKNFEKRMLKSAAGRFAPYPKREEVADVDGYIEYLLIAENHHFEELKKFLLSEEHCIITSWMSDTRMKKLSDPTLFEIAKCIIGKMFNQSPSCGDDFPNVALDMLDFIYSERFEGNSEEDKKNLIDNLASDEDVDLSQSENEEESESDKESSSESDGEGDEDAPMLPTKDDDETASGDNTKQDSSVITVQNPFVSTPTTDVKVIVDEVTLHLHASILRHCSPVFNAMLGGSFKEGHTKQITLPNKEAKTVIEFFQCFYAERNKKFKGSSDFEGLLALSQEYQVDWLIRRIEDYMVAKFDFKKNITQILIGWRCVERFPHFHALKSKIMNTDTPNYYLHGMSKENLEKFLTLQPTTKYQMVKVNLQRCLRCHSFYIDSDLGSSLKGILKFLDKLLLHN